MRQWVRKVIGKMLIISSFAILLLGISWKTPIFEIPTLFTRIETSRPFSSCMTVQKKPARSHSAKSATINLVSNSEFVSMLLILANAASILFLFLAIIQILKPRAANYSQKASPIPSLPPVTMAHDRSPYLSLQFLLGRTALMSAQRILLIQTMKTMPPIAARKQMKLSVDCSIDLQYEINIHNMFKVAHLHSIIIRISIRRKRIKLIKDTG